MTVADELGLMTACELLGALERREVSSAELLDAYLERIARLNPALNAVVTLDDERAKDAAAAADAARTAGGPLGRLHGLPMTVKDAIETAGIRSTGGAVELRHHVPVADAPAVGRLRRAGAIVFGKTNLPRWSGDLQTYNELFGATQNPWDLARTPGGSSGGAAVAVACGFSAFELGTDIGGSVRVPSAWCGVFGHKPSFGVVPQRGYLDHVGGGVTDADINVFGPIARSADDLDLVLSVLAGPAPELEAAWSIRLPPARPSSLAGARIGLWLDDPDCPVDRATGDVLSALGGLLSAQGALVSEDRPSIGLRESFDVYLPLVSSAASVSLGEPEASERAGNHRRWLELDERRAGLRAAWASYFEDHDALLCPVLPTAAVPHDRDTPLSERTVPVNGRPVPLFETILWTGLVGVAYLPSTVVPVGLTDGGLPVGVQVVGPFLGDRTTIALAGELGRLTGGYRVPPLAR
ncbi:MAG: amidase family protein [Acidimicrobiales bacterium]